MADKLTNVENIPLSMAVWLAEDKYIYNTDPDHYSATTLLKSDRQIILGKRAMATTSTSYDISQNIPSALGGAIHSGIEHAWLNNYRSSLKALGVSQRVIDRVRLNPVGAERQEPNIIPIYLEQRSSKRVGKFLVSGMFDFVMGGRLEDFKSTGVFAFMSGSNEWKYKQQGSIYRWLNPDIITEDVMAIQFTFTDWAKLRARVEQKKGYPQSRIMEHLVPLDPYNVTDNWVRSKLRSIERHEHLPEPQLPLCNQEDLWQADTTYKYFKNPNAKRATKVGTYPELHTRWLQDGSVGEIKEIKGAVKACEYCAAYNVCTQKDQLIADGLLKL